MQYKIITIKSGNANCYLLKKDEGYILIDTGFRNKRSSLEKNLAESGCVPGSIDIILITHGDADHTGNCAYLQQKYKTGIAIHSNDASLAEDGKIHMNSQVNRKIRPFLSKIRFTVIKFLFGKTIKSFYLKFETFKPDRYLEDGQSLDNLGINARVIHIPGHTKGSIGILTGNGDFFSGDTVLCKKKPVISPSAEDFNALDSSIEKIKNLKITKFYPGHGRSFTMTEFLDNIILK